MNRPQTLREKLAQLIIVRIGSNLPPIRTVEEDADKVRRQLDECPLGGLLLFNGRRQHTAETLDRLQGCTNVPLLVTADIERGVGQQLHGYPVFPHAMAFSALDEAEESVFDFAQSTAQVARASGIHVTLSPVADVNNDPQNPIISTRAFGCEPQQVSRLVAAFIRGSHAGGLLTTAKHYPGHGNTSEDSHHELPTVRSSREEMQQIELPPFQAAIEAGVSLIMTAHVCYPAFDATGKCATLSRPIVTELLRDQLGFQGAVISDSLLMEGVKQQGTNEGDLAVQAINAGVDFLLDIADPVGTLNEMERAVIEGRLDAARVEQAFERVWKLKTATFEEQPEAIDITTMEDYVLPTMEKLVTTVCRDSITMASEREGQLPFSTHQSLCVVVIKTVNPSGSSDDEPIAAHLREHFTSCEYIELGPEASEQEYARAKSACQEAEQVLVALIVKPAAWHRFGLSPELVAYAKELLSHNNCVLVSLGAIEALSEFESLTNPPSQLCTYSDVPAAQQALVQLLAKVT